MHLPIKAHYATLAMLALAEKYASREVLPARVIARAQGIPAQFLGQILQQLRAAGLISSTRGSSGGFHLDLAPEEITIGEVVDAVCANSAVAVAGSVTPMHVIVHDVWNECRIQQRQVLDRLTLADLLSRQQAAAEMMFYI